MSEEALRAEVQLLIKERSISHELLRAAKVNIPWIEDFLSGEPLIIDKNTMKRLTRLAIALRVEPRYLFSFFPNGEEDLNSSAPARLKRVIQQQPKLKPKRFDVELVPVEPRLMDAKAIALAEKMHRKGCTFVDVSKALIARGYRASAGRRFGAAWDSANYR